MLGKSGCRRMGGLNGILSKNDLDLDNDDD